MGLQEGSANDDTGVIEKRTSDQALNPTAVASVDSLDPQL
jgi:hypothetical protein